MSEVDPKLPASLYDPGFSMEPFQGAIKEALRYYFDGSDYLIDVSNAARLESAPEESYAAHSWLAPVSHRNEIAAELQVVMFEGGDGTGKEDIFKLDDVHTGSFTPNKGILPVLRPEIYGEIHLTLAAATRKDPENPMLFGGNLVMTGVRLGKVEEIGLLGELEENFGAALGLQPPRYLNVDPYIQPETTFTLAHNRYLNAHDLEVPDLRFGDLAAVYNRWGEASKEDEVLQAAAFIRVRTAAPEREKHFEELIELLEPAGPHLGHFDDEM